MGAVAETANEHGQNLYSLLHDLRKQMLLSALAGCYHQWDKELREFIEGELSKTFKHDDAKRIAWNLNIGTIFDLIAQFGWNCRALPFFRHIDACRLVVNVHKHGKGSSLEQLAATYPEFLRNPVAEVAPDLVSDFLDHE